MNKPTLSLAKRMIKKANPGIENVKVAWAHKPTWCEQKGNRGNYFWSSVVKVTADGYRPKNQVLTVDNGGTWIR
jgi:hypothetical protein